VRTTICAEGTLTKIGLYSNGPKWAESAPIFAVTILINPRLLATVYKLVGSEERKVPLLTKKGI